MTPTFVGDLPVQCAALLDPHTAGELTIDEIVALCDELIEAHGAYLPRYV